MAEKTDVEKIVEELKAMGYDARLLSGELVTVPFYENYVPCGVPNDVGDVVESTITTNAELVGNLSIYVLIAKGDSMIDCGIFDGDYLYVEPTQDVSDGNVVLASIDDEMTVKVFFEDENGDKWLVPQNDDYDPILLNGKLNIRIHGRVVHSIHRVKTISFKDCKRRVAQSRKRMNARVSSEMKDDHKQALSKGGKAKLDNSQMLYKEYNRKKSDDKLTVINVHGDAKIDTYVSDNQVFGETEVKKQSSTETAIKEAIEKLMEEVDENGCNLFTDKGQWYAVYRVLSELHNYPKKMTDFCKVMADMDFDKCRVPCKYESIGERNKNLPKLVCKVTLWQQYANISDAYKKQCVVADFLINALG